MGHHCAGTYSPYVPGRSLTLGLLADWAVHVRFMCRSPTVVRNLSAVILCDTPEQLSPPGSRRPFSRSLRRPQTLAGVIAGIMGTAAITAAVAITVPALASSAVSSSVH